MRQTVFGRGFSLPAAVIGHGKKPMVLLPGVSATPTTEAAEAVAAEYADFSDKYTIYLLDPRNDIPDGFTVEDMARDVAEALDELRVRNAYAMGVSQGGMVGLVLASRRPDLVRRLVAAGSLSVQNERSRATFDRWCGLARQGEAEKLLRDMYASIYSESYRATYRDALEAAATQKIDLRRLTVLLEACHTFDGAEHAQNVSCPVLAAGSEHDPVLSGEASLDTAARTHGRALLMPGSSHAFYDEDPVFLEKVLAFFEEETE